MPKYKHDEKQWSGLDDDRLADVTLTVRYGDKGTEVEVHGRVRTTCHHQRPVDLTADLTLAVCLGETDEATMRLVNQAWRNQRTAAAALAGILVDATVDDHCERLCRA